MLIDAYYDADWGGCTETRRSTSGFIVRVFGMPVSWLCRRQKAVTDSSTYAEYIALSSVMAELRWLHQLLTELGLHHSGAVDQGALYSTDVERSRVEARRERERERSLYACLVRMKSETSGQGRRARGGGKCASGRLRASDTARINYCRPIRREENKKSDEKNKGCK